MIQASLARGVSLAITWVRNRCESVKSVSSVAYQFASSALPAPNRPSRMETDSADLRGYSSFLNGDAHKWQNQKQNQLPPASRSS